MLLILEALLLILAALGQDHRDATFKGQIFTLDMAPNSVDDYYCGCRETMEDLVETEYLEKEINNSPDFKNAWDKGEQNALKNAFLKHKYSTAIYVYTTSNIHNKFNEDTRNGKQNYTDMTFTWYSLHFLLTEAIQVLKKTQKKCYSTYRGTSVAFNNVFTYIRFGSFTSSTLNHGMAKRFGTKSCFEIHTCEGADVTKYFMFPSEREVLIPPYETFEVIAVRTRKYQPDLWCETVFTLKSSGIKSELNCALFNYARP